MIEFERFKDRQVDLGEKVAVYRNLNRRDGVWWSIRGQSDGLVRGHARGVVLLDARPVVNTKAAARIRAGAPREVHAWVTGTLTDMVIDPRQGDFDWRPVTYRPHESDFFFDKLTGASWHGEMPVVVFTPEGLWI